MNHRLGHHTIFTTKVVGPITTVSVSNAQFIEVLTVNFSNFGLLIQYFGFTLMKYGTIPTVDFFSNEASLETRPSDLVALSLSRDTSL